MVHGIMKAHRGAVTFRSTPAKGTTVDLYFPAAETPAAPVSAPRAAEPGSRSGRRLYVDDDEAIVILARRALGRLGYRVTALSDPRAATAEFRAHPDDFDAVITDISMPGMSGFEVVEEVLGIRPGMPVVVTSGYIRHEDEEEAARLGVRAVIAKPDTVDELAGALDRILRTAVP
jgi:CheY-like chemotaxis protein